MIKFIIPTIIIFLIVLFWEKISKFILDKFNVKLNYLLIGAFILLIIGIILLLNF